MPKDGNYSTAQYLRPVSAFNIASNEVRVLALTDRLSPTVVTAHRMPLILHTTFTYGEDEGETHCDNPEVTDPVHSPDGGRQLPGYTYQRCTAELLWERLPAH